MLLIAGSSGAQPPWHALFFMRLSSLVRPILKVSARGKPQFSVSIFDAQKEVRFGRMTGSDRDVAKALPGGAAFAVASPEFSNLALSLPSRPQCGRDGLAEDVYLQLVRSADDRYVFTLAVCEALEIGELTPTFLALKKEFARAQRVDVAARTNRYWGKSKLEGFTPWIEDYFPHVDHAFKLNGRRGVDVLPGQWGPVI
ncbi:MAG TPA: hypothetical protein VGN72_08520 [Tepidisphaeraceae bacterium]|nr:hypothetical protein [Tepidisphaeraceae bacterium]